ncbi:DUF3024 domain-containing protein [Reichenbachiella sp. MSK19-1]|uniref:DUF3024 domain-containing protein n=1 Tax=Reichenbachiella sp. MSK19-1 TaxID=1897631 RepID=UPI000E6C7455|nr:DUF3024 domain-containing protein [Reichenbachiella sp. MSK19-1]RJE71558.1 hypothetical protein BGP76_05545 [Reichenbachiella sp. MSK19-1]
MPLDALQSAETINALEIFLDKRRPPEHIRHQIDLNYKIDNQSIIILEIRPHWQNEEETIESPIAKTTWVKSQNVWKIYWMRADLKWHGYEPNPEVETIEDFLKVIDQDAHGCFWG